MALTINRPAAGGKPATKGMTLRDAIRSLFPNGYLDHPGYKARLSMSADHKGGLNTHFDLPPCLAVDLFAIAGFLLLKSGGYHRISPSVSGADSSHMVIVTTADREAWANAGRLWRRATNKGLAPPPIPLTKAWRILQRYLDNALYMERPPEAPPRPWWHAALALLAIADEAAVGIGFETGEKSAQARQTEAPMRSRIAQGIRVYSLANADRDQVCVLPKSRTPKVGCTLRSLSHNLALLPSRGLARAYWTPGPPTKYKESDAFAPFNLVIIPIPFKVRATAFKGIHAKDATWGWFHIHPHWCPAGIEKADTFEPAFERFATFVEGVLDTTAKDVGVVHGLVFPEAALSYQVFEALCDRLQGRPGLELLVSGLVDARTPRGRRREGNFAAMARFGEAPNTEAADMQTIDDTGEAKKLYDLSTREKHHRWRIEKSQIDSYALGSALDVNSGWWERIDILSRSLDVFVLRGGATVTTLICEDLARNDPCQELVRGIGPNLLIALLMDGPQLKDRWPARYATVLAEDPGSSVLSVTSKGLIARSNATKRFPASDKIALWRDDSGRTEELSLPDGSHGLCLTLQPGRSKERSLDGRLNEEAQSWRLSGVVPITATDNAEITDGKWPGTSA